MDGRSPFAPPKKPWLKQERSFVFAGESRHSVRILGWHGLDVATIHSMFPIPSLQKAVVRGQGGGARPADLQPCQGAAREVKEVKEAGTGSGVTWGPFGS